MNRKLILISVLLCLLFQAACAETVLCSKCGQPHEVTYLQPGDSGIAIKGLCSALIDAGYLTPGVSISIYDDSIFDAVSNFQRDHDLRVTGIADDETLSWLLYGMDAASLQGAFPDLPEQLFWVPTDGGKRVHIRACCSKMSDPRAMSLPNALALQIEPCGTCAKKYRPLIDWVD